MLLVWVQCIVEHVRCAASSCYTSSQPVICYAILVADTRIGSLLKQTYLHCYFKPNVICKDTLMVRAAGHRFMARTTDR